ncbi:MAG: small metal-binding protein SmbP [Nitrospira sp.]|nr:small metal-binding protein SmbP [Nitrospira sp.]
MRCDRSPILTVLSVVLFTVSPAWSQGSHIEEALQHAQAAAMQGRQDYPDELVKQAKEALRHAEQAAKGNDNPHLASGIGALKRAIEHGRAGQNTEATKAAEEAATHLSQVTAAAPAVAPAAADSGY